MQETLKAEACATQLIIGEGVSVTGKFVVPGLATIHGTLDGELKADELFLGRTGVICGDIVARTADISGTCKRSLSVAEFLCIRKTGRVYDRAACGEVEVERGGVVNGALTLGAGLPEEPTWGHTQPRLDAGADPVE